jgi:hypothetical protein
MELAALEPGPSAEEQRHVWRDGESHELPPAGVLRHDDRYRQSRGEQPQDQIGQSFHTLMKSSLRPYISH